MEKSLKTENIDFLEKFFPEFKPRLSKEQYVGAISVFSFFFETEEGLNDKWESVTSSIAVNYQSEFEDEEQEFERWNMYIFFIVKGSVSDQLKYKIENNKFSCRKIVQDNIDVSSYLDSIKELTQKNIINSDLNRSLIDDNDTSAKIPPYSSDSTIYKLIEDHKLNNSRKRTGRAGREGENIGSIAGRFVGERKAVRAGARFVARNRRRKGANIETNKEDIDSLYQQIIKEIKDEI